MIQRSTLRAQIAAALREDIVAARLPAGRQFTVKEIAEQYGVSATPVREALVDLSAQGLLDMEQHRGFRVHEFGLADYRAMVEARALIVEGVFRQAMRVTGPGQAPGQVARQVAEQVPEATQDLIHEAVSATHDAEVVAGVVRRGSAAERAALKGELDVLIGCDLRFWRELGSTLANPYLSEFLDRIRVQCWAYVVPHLRQRPDLSGQLWSGHRELAEAIRDQDVPAARRLVADYNAHSLALGDTVSEASGSGTDPHRYG
ncbi:GntR family transcriptional regulator [Streptomyces sp. NPDC005438]|uniref:GntR family transcriptional regulator n=1 Tax=Streptomyces sp. NPDC005438 TaxID=3156880 RepID=UPI00339EDF79